MAVGIGVGGFLGGIQGGWALRKAANSKAMVAERVGAYDPKGFERVRRGSGPIDDFLGRTWLRSEEHTSELQSLMRISYAVFCLKKQTTNKLTKDNTYIA